MNKTQNNIQYNNLEDTFWKFLDSLRGNSELTRDDGVATILFLLTLKRLFSENEWKLIRNNAMHNINFSIIEHLSFSKNIDQNFKEIIKIYTSHYNNISTHTIIGLITNIDILQISKTDIDDETFSLLFESIILKLISRSIHLKEETNLLNKDIQQLICKLITPRSNLIYYLPMVGTGLILHDLYRLIKKESVHYYGNEMNRLSFFILNLIIIHNNMQLLSNFLLEKDFNFKFLNENNQMFYDRVICTPPFNSKIPTSTSKKLNINNKYKNIPDFIPNTFSELFIYQSIADLRKSGKAIFLLPNSFLYSMSKSSFSLRKYLINNDIIQAVIGLPKYMSPLTNISTSLLILKKNKKNLKNKIMFIDCTNKDISVHQNEIFDTYIRRIENNFSKIYNKQVVINNGYDLSTNRYINIMPVKANLIFTKNGYKLSSKFNFIKGVQIANTKKTKMGIPFVRIKDLSKEKSNLYLSTKDCELRNLTGKNDKIISQTSLLIARIGRDLKPVIFSPEYTGIKEIIINNNVIGITPKSQSLNLEFLYFQFYEKHILQQISIYGTTIPYFDLAEIKDIIIPNVINEADKVKLYKHELVKEAQKEFLDKIKNFDENKDNIESESLLLSSLSHNNLPIINNIDSFLKIIRKRLDEKKNIEVFSLLEKAQQNLKLVEKYINNLNKYAKKKCKPSDFHYIDISDLLRESINNFKPEGLTANITEDFEPAMINLYKDFIKELISLLLTNAKKHAFKKITKSDMIIFKGYIHGKHYILEYSNNGSPSTITTENFITPGFRGNKKVPGDGFGGAHINKIIQVHKGKLEIEPRKKGIMIRFTFPYDNNKKSANQ